MTQGPGRRRLGRSGLPVTAIGIGTSPLGGMPSLYGYDVGEEQAIATVLAALESPVRFLDTSNGYADAERRIGAAIGRRGGLPDDYVLATKVDPLPGSLDFSGSRVRASLEESLTRLGVSRLKLLYLHDPERISFETAMSTGGPVRELVRLRDEGVVDHLGVAGGDLTQLAAYIDTDIFDVMLTHSRFTLLDRSASELIDIAHARGIGVVNAAPFAAGLLSRGPGKQPGYAYPADDQRLNRKVDEMIEASSKFSIPLAAAALQLSLHDERISSTVVGMSSPTRLQSLVELAQVPIPEELWTALHRISR
ncbi:aldo/keto reductase [Frondihabitans australicus]|uniref:D-threo-aldose 1-dehydrogenase n=1 Tax=Frondihabitans australicus TaxID=386892 RepID=A0A495IKF1_9MICO|nr:aldo/keto reductase [Frondihabitans australicus]RKR76433.1 D-threo-aldose 1-dehydrogenase [Frondihabitans australicus]